MTVTPVTSLSKNVMIGFLVLVVSAMVYLPGLKNPSAPCWDEFYYLSAVQRHIEGTATYASHPPMGLMLLTAGASLADDNKTVPAHTLAQFNKITDRDVPKGYSFYGIRVAAAVAAIAGALLFYAIMLALVRDAITAGALSALFIFENAFVIQFRTAHLDAFQVAFVLAGLLVWLRKKREPLHWHDFALFGAFIGLAFSVKTNAAVLMALPAIAVLRTVWQKRFERLSLVNGTVNSCAAFGAFVAVVILVFTANIMASPRPPDPRTDAGKHDIELMGPAYLDYLHGRAGLTPEAWRQAISGYVHRMNNDFSGVTKFDANGQSPLTWPFYTKPISYRWDSKGAITAYSTLVGNPVGWRLSFIGILAGLSLIVLYRIRPSVFPDRPDREGNFAKLDAVLLMYAVFLATHAYLGRLRVMYVYHHFIGLILGFIALALSYEIATSAIPALKKRRFAIASGISLAVMLGFWFYAPFTYHRGISFSDCQLRNIPVHQFDCNGL